MNEKEKMIITAAEEVFARFGYKKATMEDIATQAHIGKATLYYYFPSKEVIFGEVIKKDSEHFKTKLNGAALSANKPEDKIRAYITARMEHLEDLKKFYPMLTQEYLDHYFFVENVRKEFHDYENTVLSKLLQDGIDQNDFFIDDVECTARMLAIAIKGLEYPMLQNQEGYDIIQESNRMLDIIFNGIKKRDEQ